ncbi:hypothetical protein EJB05_41197, partial [Eragrostis curvula]
MAVPRALVLISCFLCCYAAPALSSSTPSGDFLKCLTVAIPSQLLLTQSSPSFTSVLQSTVRNPKFLAPSIVRPLCVVTATNASHVQAAVLCGRRHGVPIRVRSGGHDYEGLSYRSYRLEVFAVVDLAKLRAVRVNRRAATAWVDSGATVGEIYEAGKVWGEKYFRANYRRLAIAKGKIDPDDYFRNEQSIPPLVLRK